MLRVSEKCKNDDSSKLTLVSMFHWLEHGCSQIIIIKSFWKVWKGWHLKIKSIFDWLVHVYFLYPRGYGCIWSHNSWLYNAASLCYLVAVFLKVPEIYISYFKKKKKRNEQKRKKQKQQ